jgi:YHS domain-containing protein
MAMTNTQQPDLRQRIERLLAEHRHVFTQRAVDRDTEMTTINAFRRQFEQVYESWRSDIICPKFAVVVSHRPPGSARVVQGTCETTLILRPNAEFKVAATVVLKVFPDLIHQRVRLSFEVSILPILLDFDRGAEIEAGLDDPSRKDLAAFLDEHLSIFVADYCRIHSPDSPYLKNETVNDPICGMSFLRAEAKASVQQGSNVIYFCSVACKERFEREKAASQA